MAADYHHGVRVVEVNEGVRSIRVISTSIVGLVATADDADAEKFPLNEPVLITNVHSAIGDAGKTGTLSKVLTAIGDQAKPVVVVVRVADADSPDQLKSNVIGTTTDDGKYTGLKALLTAHTKVKVKPRILGIPGLEDAETIAALASTAEKLRAFAYASDLKSKNVTEAIAFRETFGKRELMLIWPQFTGWNTKTNQREEIWASAVALGLRAKLDNEIGWHKTLSNITVDNVTGISKDITWDLQDPDTDAGLLNSKDITTLTQDDGFKFWGSRTCAGPTSKFPFESYTRTAQILADTIADAHKWAVDKPLHPSLAKDIIEGINKKFSELRKLGYIIDGNAWFDPDKNLDTVLASGKMYVDYDYTPVPPLENLEFHQHITSSYLLDFAAQIASSN